MAMGRKRSFDAEAALDRAMRVFWRHGYEGASLAELTAAMGISPPSLYAAFGNKEQLFAAAVARYAAGPASHVAVALAAPTARQTFVALLQATVERLSDPGTPPGCLMVQGALAAGEAGAAAQQALAAAREAAVAALAERFARAAAAGELPSEEDPQALARFTMTVIHGMAVQAAGGADRAALAAVAALALRAWPSSIRAPGNHVPEPPTHSRKKSQRDVDPAAGRSS
jgi:AcrR family transcriptional regulator